MHGNMHMSHYCQQQVQGAALSGMLAPALASAYGLQYKDQKMSKLVKMFPESVKHHQAHLGV